MKTTKKRQKRRRDKALGYQALLREKERQAAKVHKEQYRPIYKERAKKYKQEIRCFYCGIKVIAPTPEEQSFQEYSRDHILPKSKGGDGQRTNLVTCCKKCNFVKGDTHYLEYIKFIEKYTIEKVRAYPHKKLHRAYQRYLARVKEQEENE